jgi:hypothetical protein
MVHEQSAFEKYHLVRKKQKSGRDRTGMPRTALAAAAGALALAACITSLGLGVPRAAGGGRLGHVLVEIDGNPMGNVPSISSSCITNNKACIVAVPGGSLRLTDIHFPGGPGAPGAADAVGYVNGHFVSGTIQMSTQAVHDVDREGHDKAVVDAGGPPAPTLKPWAPVQLHTMQHKQKQLQAQKDRARQSRATRGRGLLPAKNAQKLADVDHEKAAEEQYKAALAAVEGHMKERMEKVEEEATKIAEAVTRVITSPQVSKKIADLAMDAAAAKAGPAAEASETGGVQGGIDGVGQFGYSNEPAGTEGAGCGPGCAGMVATTPDLDTVAMPPPPASTAFYAGMPVLSQKPARMLSPAVICHLIKSRCLTCSLPSPALSQPGRRAEERPVTFKFRSTFNFRSRCRCPRPRW